jgi:predicted transcriptional regulator
VALLKAPTKQKTTSLQVRLEEDVRVSLNKYAQFIDANSSYVVSEALKLLFKRDQEFKRWLGQHKTGGLDQNEEAALAKAASQT